MYISKDISYRISCAATGYIDACPEIKHIPENEQEKVLKCLFLMPRAHSMKYIYIYLLIASPESNE